jgi:hypothetical protein
MVTVKVLKRRYPSTPARAHRWHFRVLRGLATFSTLFVVVISALVAPYMGVPVVGKVRYPAHHLASHHRLCAIFHRALVSMC